MSLQPNPFVIPLSEPLGDVAVKLEISRPPRLGETAHLTVTVVSVFDVPWQVFRT